MDRSLSPSRARAPARLVTLAALVALILPCTPAAARPPTVAVRIEGAGATLLPQTLVQTTAATRIRGHTCSGSSAAGALNIATRGSWTGEFESGSGFADFFITGVLGETATGNDFWTLWVNGRTASTGACATHVHAGDRELWFDCVADSHYNCTNNPLGLSAPAAVRIGRPFTASVVQLDGAGHSSPITDAAITGAGVVGESQAGGRTRLVARHVGLITLQATKSGATPSDPISLCVYRAQRRECSTSAAPQVRVRGIHEHQVFVRGPRSLHGTAGPDPAGLTDVSFSLKRHAPNHRCSYFDADRGRWTTSRCQTPAPLFSIGADSSWSYLLPAPLPPGSYHLRVVATDGTGHRTPPVTGKSVLDFRVK